MESLHDDILFYNIIYSSYDVAILLSLVCKRFYNISRGYGKELRTPKGYFLEYVEKQDKYGCKKRYWINKFTKEKEGKYEKWWENMNKETECNYKYGKLEGKYEEWYKNGNKRIECWYKDNKREEKYEFWRGNGNKMIQCWYKDDKSLDKYEEWYPNENKMMEY
ncbi:MORN-repeat protein [Orpheovirus IHUMI-LCC2]|uniref:MORN-repeat protein n=1 Tax=Orpheovirus IHUMI-LCC2 TaxID=2023057 RepID=A0A2I2L5N9_9VIRU|nr:MORN-repeat protein [Orpheovirus IHUMI-LCC2]SNW62836.1 MORN-repeat protein [Orpheovirus IHUMI-LCC2]